MISPKKIIMNANAVAKQKRLGEMLVSPGNNAIGHFWVSLSAQMIRLSLAIINHISK